MSNVATTGKILKFRPKILNSTTVQSDQFPYQIQSWIEPDRQLGLYNVVARFIHDGAATTHFTALVEGLDRATMKQLDMTECLKTQWEILPPQNGPEYQ